MRLGYVYERGYVIGYMCMRGHVIGYMYDRTRDWVYMCMSEDM